MHIEKNGESVKKLFADENFARLEFEVQRKRGMAAEDVIRKDIDRLQVRLNKLTN